MASLVATLPKPLVDDIIRNRCIPIVGSGFSRNARTSTGEPIPGWHELAKSLSAEITGGGGDHPLDTLSFYAHAYSKATLLDRVTRLLRTNEAKPGSAHQSFASCPFDIVVTTNWDFLLEDSYRAIARACRPWVVEEQASQECPRGTVNLMKIHGDLNHPKELVITEDDYDRFLQTRPLMLTQLAAWFITRTPLIIGYSMDDHDLRAVWRTVTDRLGHLRRPAYALVVGSAGLLTERYERRGVKVCPLPGKPQDYGAILSQLFIELRELWVEREPTIASALPEESALPPDATTPLCLVALPANWSLVYRRVIAPILQGYGLAPVSVSELSGEKRSFAAEAAAMASRAEAMVVHQDYAWIARDTNRSTSQRVLLIADGPTGTGSVPDLWTQIRIDGPNSLECEAAISAIEEWAETNAARLRQGLVGEPLQLLEKRLYRAAVVSAFTMLEFAARELSASPYMSWSSLLALLQEIGLLPAEATDRLNQMRAIRNRVVHGDYRPRPTEAKDLVGFVTQLVGRLQKRSEAAPTSNPEIR